MLRVVAHKSAAAASQYYAEGLKREDYYSEGQEVAGKWHGKAAERLGLSGKVTPEAFAALVDNRHPDTGKRLTPRMKTDRVVGYDINFHAPKSLSVLHALTQDGDILKAFRSAVAETMAEIEGQATTRIRKNWAQDNRATGNLAWAEFIHFTARPVGGIPDPHLHAHCFTFNATFDETEKRWKAAKFRQIKQDAPYNEAAFHARLAAKLSVLGYGIQKTAAGWEIEGVPRSLITKFSRRTAEIERIAEERGITDDKLKDGLGALTRQGKRHGLTYSDLLAAWGSRMTEAEKVLVSKLRFDREPVQAAQKVNPVAAVDYAIEKAFSKNSVIEQNRLVAEALRYGVGSVKPEQIWRELGKRDMIARKTGDQIFCTTLEILAEEVALIQFARAGRGAHPSIKPGKVEFENAKLSSEQKNAVKHILGSKDQVIALRGGAGVGKTTLMKEAAAQIQAQGLRLFAFAPSASASRETLRNEGFTGANTVAHLLQNKKLQDQTRGQVIWIDEAGLLGIREMWEVIQLAGQSTRVILTGDSGQHAPVARGDAFRLLQKYAGLKIAEVTEIRRQEQATYKAAVKALSEGDLANAFHSLDSLGAIVEVESSSARYKLLASDFMELSRKGKAPLVVSPTHAESARVTEAIREAKREAGLLKGERVYNRFHNLQWENADKRRPESYSEGLLVQFHQNDKGIKRGEMFRVTGVEIGGVVRAVAADGRSLALPLQHAERFQVFEEKRIQLGKGDQIRITRNGESLDGKRLNNGNVYEVAKIKKNGDIILSNGTVLDSQHGHFTHGYCQTSHSSQSKSVRDVLVAQSEDSFVASSREQFYVSISRGKESIRIYTDNRDGLQQAVGNSSIRESGLEFAGLKKRDLAAMHENLTSRQFSDMVKSRHAAGQVSHEKALSKELKLQPGYQESATKWQDYCKARRALHTGGKGRSKGATPENAKKGPEKAFRYRSFLRPTELTTETTKKLKEAHEQKKVAAPQPEKSTQKSRLADSLTSAAKHFQKFMKCEQGAPKPAAPGKAQQKAVEAQLVQQGKQGEQMAKQQAQKKASLPKTNLNQALNHAIQQQQVQNTPKPAPPPPPVKTKQVVVPPPAPKK